MMELWGEREIGNENHKNQIGRGLMLCIHIIQQNNITAAA